MVSSHASSVSVFWGYGANDALIREEISKESIKLLTSVGKIPTKPMQGINQGYFARSTMA